MAKKQNVIVGRVISPNRVKISNPQQVKLVHGQKVLIYKETDQSIISTSGRFLGKKEQVLGVGRVHTMGGHLIISRGSNPNYTGLRQERIVAHALVNSGKKLKKSSRRVKPSLEIVRIKPIDE